MVSTATVFSLPAYADSAPDMPSEPDFASVLILGQVNINGNLAKSGATLISGSTVVTGADGIAIIELGALGRATVGPGTAATITYSYERLLITTECNDMRVSVRQGQCTIRPLRKSDHPGNGNGASPALKAAETKTLVAVQDEHFDSNVEVSANAVIDVVVNCGTDVVCPAPVAFEAPASAWPLGYLLLGGLGGITAVLVKTGGPRRRVSDTRPQS